MVKALVVGLGSIGTRHARNLLALGVDVVACEPSAERRTAAASLDVRLHDDLASALAEAPDVGVVCVPNHLHVQTASAIVAKGIHVFVEKPVADSLRDAEALVAQADTRGVVGLVACNMRFHPALAEIKRAAEAGALGRILHVRASFGHYLPNWRPAADYRASYSSKAAEGGGILLDAIHEIDLARWIGGDVSEVCAQAAKVSDLEMDVEDVADVTLRFAGGARGLLHMDYLDRVKRRSFEVIGTEATMLWRSTRKSPEEAVVELHRSNTDSDARAFHVDPNEPYLAQMRHLLDCVEGRSKPACTLRDGMRALEIVEAARRSARTGRTIELPFLQTPVV